ncbi:DUF262 domain-containing protein [Streptomyces sp. NPDC024017]|uniref:DUF262 domain-containing protein n=1 Tax=Streptomyces sp. NPDC024017 TaxID=3154326 RepID=UPI0033DC9507
MSEEEGNIFEESPAELEVNSSDIEPDSDLRERWERHQRDLISHAMDFTVWSVVSLVREGNLDLFPEFERRDRWDIHRKSRLIESFLLNIPIPAVFLNEEDYGQYSVIDGKQRITALVEFIEGHYALRGLGVLREAEGKTYQDLDPAIQRSLTSTGTIRAVILRRLSDPDMKYEVFARLNTGGVPLNAQELRNAVHPGPFNRLTVELSEDLTFQAAIDSGPFSAIYREMRDVELVLRYFTLVDDPLAYRRSMAHALTNTLARKNHSTPQEIEWCKTDFLSSFNKCRAAFGDLLFRRWQPERNAPSKRISVAVYEAQMIAVRDWEISKLTRNSWFIQERTKELFTLPEFQESLRFGNQLPHSLVRRVEFFKELLDRAAR